LRIVDLVKLHVAGGTATPASGAPISVPVAGSDGIVYTFDVTLQTYWLK
jgi:hypothetical protein